jgi:hypothetical protein
MNLEDWVISASLRWVRVGADNLPGLVAITVIFMVTSPTATEIQER